MKVLPIGQRLNKYVRVTIRVHFRQHKIAIVYEIVFANVPRWRCIIR